MLEAATIPLPSIESAIALAGEGEENLKILQKQTGVQAVLRGQQLHLSGTANQIERASRLIQSLHHAWGQGQAIDAVDILTAIHALDTKRQGDFADLQREVLARNRRGEEIRAKTFRQRSYLQAIQNHALTFCIGPAGTGKTFLATVLAAQALLKGEYERLILTRPAVEAGERLGFLPGDLQQKINPYLRPLYDALHEIVEPERISTLMEKGVIEVAPLAYMRGRTLSNSFVILDEAQNTTPAQMKMVLTRLGHRSRMVVTGDVTQTDLPATQTSGLAIAEKILRSVEGISFCYLNQRDVVRHPLVQRIVEAYAVYEES